MATHYLYSCLGNPVDGGAWWATVHRVAKSQTRLSTYAETKAQVALGEVWLFVPCESSRSFTLSPHEDAVWCRDSVLTSLSSCAARGPVSGLFHHPALIHTPGEAIYSSCRLSSHVWYVQTPDIRDCLCLLGGGDRS